MCVCVCCAQCSIHVATTLFYCDLFPPLPPTYPLSIKLCTTRHRWQPSPTPPPPLAFFCVPRSLITITSLYLLYMNFSMYFLCEHNCIFLCALCYNYIVYRIVRLKFAFLTSLNKNLLFWEIVSQNLRQLASSTRTVEYNALSEEFEKTALIHLLVCMWTGLDS